VIIGQQMLARLSLISKNATRLTFLYKPRLSTSL